MIFAASVPLSFLDLDLTFKMAGFGDEICRSSRGSVG